MIMENKEFDFHEIKTFEDACKRLGISKDTQLLMTHNGNTESFLQASALYKLLIIQKAINNGISHDEYGFSYYPYWVFYSKKEMENMSDEEKQKNGVKELISCDFINGAKYDGIRCSEVSNRGVLTYCGFLLNYNSGEVSQYVAKQFESLFFQYYGIKIKE